MSHSCLCISVFQVFARVQSYFYVREITEAKEKGWVRVESKLLFLQASVKIQFFMGNENKEYTGLTVDC